jgi:hypothetical protein
MKTGTKVILTDEAKNDTYPDMPWVNDEMIITHAHDDGQGIGDIYSFDSLTSNEEITCSMYEYELIEI